MQNGRYEAINRKRRRSDELLLGKRGTLVRDVVALHNEPRPSRTTVATFVKFLEQKGYLDHKAEGTSYISQ